jgi:hypothetical protein
VQHPEELCTRWFGSTFVYILVHRTVTRFRISGNFHHKLHISYAKFLNDVIVTDRTDGQRTGLKSSTVASCINIRCNYAQKFNKWAGKLTSVSQSVCLLLRNMNNENAISLKGRSRWPRVQRREMSSSARTLGSWVRIKFKAWIFVCVHSVFV